MKRGSTFSKLMMTAAAGAGLFMAQPTAKAEEAKPNTGAVSFSAGVDFWTHYFFRGILQENQGVITQPYGAVTIKLMESDGPINSISITGGVWHSFHTGPTGTDEAPPLAGDPEAWYESDIYGGLTFGVLNDFTLAVTYTAYTSPNDLFNTIQDINFSLAYADAKLWEGMGLKGFALNPSFAAIVETDDQADFGNSINGTLPDSSEGVFYQFAIAPAFTIIDSKEFPITLTIPVTLGLGDDYFEVNTGGTPSAEDDTFGFVQVGAVVSAPLTFIPAKFGAWTVKAGIHGLFLGDTTEFMNNNEDFELLGNFGISMTY
jgi:hypothetical protein